MKIITLLIASLLASSAGAESVLRLGIVGLDTSHVTAFTEILHNPQAPGHVPGARVDAAFKGGSPDIPSSIGRVEEFTATLQNSHGVEICDTIEDMCRRVDAVMIESVDGRPHLEQARAVIAAKKPVYIDKPLSGTLAGALEIFRLAREQAVPIFTSSSLRFATSTQAVRSGSIGPVLSAETTSPAHLEKSHPDLFWYGVHGCESLFTVMGTGCEKVVRTTTADGKIEVTGHWAGGRTGVFRESDSYGGTARSATGQAAIGAFDGYAPLVAEIIKFFRTGVPPVSEAETTELFAFMEAADESKRRHGQPVTLAEVLATARAQKP